MDTQEDPDGVLSDVEMEDINHRKKGGGKRRWFVNSGSDSDTPRGIVSKGKKMARRTQEQVKAGEEQELMPGPRSVTALRDRRGDDIIIIEPENGDAFFASTVAVYKLIKNSIIGEAGIAECTRNLSKKVYVLKLSSTANIQEILALQKLGEYKVKCYKPLSNTHKIGVIGPIGKETKAEELE